MSSSYGKNIRITIFGQSHSDSVGVCVDGLPAGFPVDPGALDAFLKRRSSGNKPYATARAEPDRIEILSGIAGGRTCGAPLTAVIRNTDVRSGDYSDLRDIPRPSHADYGAQIKFKGFQDVSGGGHFSGRLTAPLCVAGGICLQILKTYGIEIAAHIYAIGGVADLPFDLSGVSEADFDRIRSNGFPVLDAGQGQKMLALIEKVRSEGDSVGGIVECAVLGMPAGLGDPIYDGIENRVSSAVFGIPAVKGIEFGNGFACAALKGSENNDGFYIENGVVRTKTNSHGGILGGITSGMPVVFRAAFKPTPSIAKEQDSISFSRQENVRLAVRGRHDPCIVPRAVPCVEAAAAVAVFDVFLENKKI